MMLLASFLSFVSDTRTIISANEPERPTILQTPPVATQQNSQSETSTPVRQQEQTEVATTDEIRLLRYNLQSQKMLQSWNENDLSQTRHWLRSLVPPDGEEDLRDFSWYYFNRLCRPARTIEHGGRCNSVAFSLQGSYLSSVGGNNVKLWTVDDTQLGGVSQVGQFPHQDASVVAFSPDGTMLASGPGHIGGSVTRSVQIWRVKPFERIAEFDGGVEAVFSPDNQMVAVIAGAEVKLFDPHQRKEIASLKGHTKAVRSVAFSPDSTRVATGSPDRTAKVWETKDGKLLSTIDQHGFYVEAVAFWKTNSQLLTAERGGPIRLWNLPTLEDTKRFHGQSRFNDGDTGIIFSHDGDCIALTAKYSDDSFVDVWHVPSGRKLRRIKKRGSWLEAAFAAQAPWFAIASKDESTVELWNATTWEPQETFRIEGSDPMWLGNRLALSPAGDKIAVVSGSNVLLFTATSDSKIPATGGFAFARERPELIYLEGSKIRVRDSSGTQPLREWDAVHAAALSRIAMSSDGSARVASIDGSSSVYVWSQADSKPQTRPLIVDSAESQQQKKARKPTVQAISISPSGRLIVATGRKIPLQILDTREERDPIRISDDTEQSVVAVSDSGIVATVGKGTDEIELWNAESGKRIAALEQTSSWPFALSFSRDGAYLASSSIRATKVWRLSDQKCIRTIELRKLVSNPPAFHRVMAFLPDSKSIVVGGTRKVRQINLETGEIMATFTPSYWEDNVWNLQRSNRSRWSSADSEVTLVSVSNDGDSVAAQFGDGRLLVWRVSDQKGVAATRLDSQAVAMGFSKDGDGIVAGSTRFESFAFADGSWRYLPSPRGTSAFPDPALFGGTSGRNARLRMAYSVHKSVVATWIAVSGNPAYHGQQRYFADVQLWDVANGNNLGQIRPSHDIHSVGFIENAPVIVLAGSSVSTLWNTKTGERLKRIEVSSRPLAFSPDGRLCASLVGSSRELGVRLQSLDGGEPRFLSHGPSKGIHRLKFSKLSSGKTLLAAVGDDRVIKVWDYESGSDWGTLVGHSGAVFDVAFSSDGNTLVSGGADRKVRIWDLRTKTERASIDVEEEVHRLAFSSDGKSIAVGFGKGGVQLLLGSGD